MDVTSFIEGRGAEGGVDVKLTKSVVVTCIVAASTGLIFGNDIGISGGVTTMEAFLEKFFPSVLRQSRAASTSLYCMYDSQILTAFTSSLSLAALFSSFVAGRVSALIGRRGIMLVGGCLFLTGSALNAGAENVAMLIIGRILLGLGVGFTNQATPLYLSEVAPPKLRGVFNAAFQLFIAVGVIAANTINYFTKEHTWGWRLSLGLAAIPAIIMTIGALFILDTPNSLVERGKMDEAKQSLIRIRGKDTSVDAELTQIINASEISREAKQEPFLTMFKRIYRPQIVIGVLLQGFQQLTGINIIAFYAPLLFKSIGFGENSAFLASIILAVVNLLAIIISTGFVDRYGRRFLLIIGGTIMFLCMVIVSTVFGVAAGGSHAKALPTSDGIVVLVMMCIHVFGFGLSWGPLSWLIPSEIFPIKIRPTGQGLSVAVSLGLSFVLTQTFLTMLCHITFGLFLFYASWIVVMTTFIIFFLPETKGIPIDSMYVLWGRHWFWSRFVQVEEKSGSKV